MKKKSKDKKEKINIAYIVSAKSGLESFIFQEIDLLRKKGINIHLFTTKYLKDDIFCPPKEWPCEKISFIKDTIKFPLYFFVGLTKPKLFASAIMDNSIIDLLIAIKYSSVMKRNKIKHIHAHFGDHKFFIGYYCKKILGGTLSVTIHAHEFYTNPNSKLFKKALMNTDKIITIADKWKKLLKKEYNINENRLFVQKISINQKIFMPKEKMFKILAVGRFTERKGFKYLLDAAAINKTKNYQYIFVGWGEEKILNYAKELEIEDKVIIFSKLDPMQLSVIYNSADILVVPSITTKKEGGEGIPVVLMEGMASGLPVIATNCGATSELVRDYLIEERSSSQIAEKINLLANSKDNRKRQGLLNQEIIKKKHSTQNIDFLLDYFKNKK